MNSYYEKFLATGEIKCIDDEIPFEIPEGWEWCRFGTIMINRDCERIPLSVSQRQHLDKIYDYYGASGVIDKVDKYLFDRDLLLIGEDGANLINRSTPIAFIASGKYWVNNHAHVLDVCGGLNLKYIALFINAISLVDYVTGTAQPKMNQEKMNSILVAVPPTKEQIRILNRFSIIEPLIDRYNLKKRTLEQLNSSIYSTLRKSILQEAIQGKLVPQDPNDEPASVLLERIREEKLRLLKEGKLKKKDITDSVIFKGEDNKYFEKIGNDILCLEDEMLFDIPDKWMWTRLSTIANLYTGNSISETDKKQKYTNVYGLEYIGTKDVGFDHLINYSNGVAIPLQHIENFKIAPSHSVLLCIEGGSAGRKIARLQKDVCFGNKLCCLSPYFVSLSEYIYYYLQSPAFFESFQGNIAGIIGGVSVNTLKSLLIPLPPIEEIKRITIRLQEVLSSIMSR